MKDQFDNMVGLGSLKPAVIGLGYVGLPLAVEMAKKYDVVGFDINHKRVHELRNNVDATKEVSTEELKESVSLKFSSNEADLADCNIYVVTVPTPIDKAKCPDLSPLISASKTVGIFLKRGDIVVFESTVYPGATEEVCIPILESEAGLKFNQDFFVGYSPERINPGDNDHRVGDILKVTSGSNESTASTIDDFYASFIAAGTFKAASIKTAEAAKVIENIQRDVNIALINEFSLLFEKLGIDTLDVLEAAGTKWNFLKFTPGLVGGHCISVDPYYLTHCAHKVGYNPELILAGRRVNDAMPEKIVNRLLSIMVKRHINFRSARVLVLGITFKENCPDIRNTKVVEIIELLDAMSVQIDVYDPIADPNELWEEYERRSVTPFGKYDVIIGAVKHTAFEHFLNNLDDYLVPDGIVYDLKGFLPRKLTSLRL